MISGVSWGILSFRSPKQHVPCHVKNLNIFALCTLIYSFATKYLYAVESCIIFQLFNGILYINEIAEQAGFQVCILICAQDTGL